MRRYSGFKKPKAKKIRPLVRVNERILKRGGKCAGCRGRYEIGDRVTVATVKRKVFHLPCTPADPRTIFPLAVGGGSALSNTPDAVVKALTANWSVGEAKLVAIQALENAMAVIAKNEPITDAREKAFGKYVKLKGMFMRPGSDNEGQMAAKYATIEVVKAFF